MGANEFNSESAFEQGDGDYRIVDERTEESGKLLERVREEQCRLSAAINSLTGAVAEYAQVLNHIREVRVKRVKERGIVVKAELEQSDKPNRKVDSNDSRVEEYDPPKQDRDRGFSL